MRWTASAAACILVATAVGGCGGTAESRRAVRSAAWQEIHAVVERHRSQVTRLEGSGRLSLETPDIAQSGSFELSVHKPDSLLLRIEGPFGIRVGAILLTRDSVKFYSSLENRLYLGSAQPANLRRILRVEVSVDDLMGLLSGGGFLTEDRGAPDSATVEEDAIVEWYSSHGLTRRYVVDGSTLLLRRMQVLDDRGHLQWEQAFMEFRPTDGLDMPYLLRTIRPRERQMFSLRYSDLTLNPRQADLAFSVPASAELIRWHE